MSSDSSQPQRSGPLQPTTIDPARNQERVEYLLGQMARAEEILAAFPSIAQQDQALAQGQSQHPDPLFRLMEPLWEIWPEGVSDTFIDTGLVMSDCVFSALNEQVRVDEETLFGGDPTTTYSFGADDLVARTYPIPYVQTITALLGRDAPRCILMQSREGYGKIQPHEFSRGGWHRLLQMRQQLRIESELRQMMGHDPTAARVVVAAAWTLAAFGAHIHPAVFTLEGRMQLSAFSAGTITTSVGKGTETIAQFWPSSVRNVVRFLREALTCEELDACDLMWLAAGLARVGAHSAGWGEPETGGADSRLFLSHRGRDVKKDLTQAVLACPSPGAVFLDCLSMPRGLINRHFVFRNLARARSVVIVDSPNFRESVWCRKEAWTADTLARLGLAEVHRCASPEEVPALLNQARNEATVSAHDRESGWLTNRVLKDVDYYARGPNLHTARESGQPVAAAQPVLDWLQRASPQTVVRDEVVSQIRSLFDAVESSLTRWREEFPTEARGRRGGLDLWAAAVQLTIGALSLRTGTYFKMETRRYLAAANRLTAEVLAWFPMEVPGTSAARRSWLLLVAGATALDLAASDRPEVHALGLADLLGDFAISREGLLLLDMRHETPDRDDRLRCLLRLVVHDLGSVGVLQDGQNPVHNRVIDGICLDFLPCVTLYPGMEPLFPELPG